MNELIAKINDISTTNTFKTHDLLDRVLTAEAETFNGTEIRFDNERVVFLATIENHDVVVMRDLNTFTVVARVASNGTVVAECSIAINGQFNESYGRISNLELKHRISDWFSAIGGIDTETLQDKYPEAEEPVVESPEPVEPAVSVDPADVEVVSNGDGPVVE